MDESFLNAKGGPRHRSGKFVGVWYGSFFFQFSHSNLECAVLVTSVKPIWEPISSDPRSYILFLRAYA